MVCVPQFPVKEASSFKPIHAINTAPNHPYSIIDLTDLLAPTEHKFDLLLDIKYLFFTFISMATMLKSLSFFVFLLTVNSLFFIETTEARPFNIMKSGNSAASRGIEIFFDGLSLGGIKEGPSPGAGHGFTNGGTLGGIKEGSSPGVGHGFTNGGTLGGIKEGPSPWCRTWVHQQCSTWRN
ncbi:hypothetical protein OIU85_015633 [Salix viminalis]|uniref:Uncharacterized protein n=1 Tax=Salix viminalis TaxID=40686 RepID=A0A9Q0V3G2_SALVM|nr:hypothetical protein OIU85_015633 [Salix viminalis]